MILRANTKKGVFLKNFHANEGVAVEYRKDLQGLLKELHASLLAEIAVTVRMNNALAADSSMAQDMSFAMIMQNMFKRFGLRWQNRLDQLGGDIAKRFANSSLKHNDLAFKKVLRDAGFTVKFTMTPDIKNVLDASIADNVSLISDLSSSYVSGVEQAVFRSIASGFDLATLTDELQNKYDIEKKRAVGIAIDQTRKAKQSIEDQRRLSLGITQAAWRHSGGGVHPRKDHVAADGELYDIVKGCLISGEYIKPGQLRFCGCTSRAFIRGFDS